MKQMNDKLQQSKAEREETAKENTDIKCQLARLESCLFQMGVEVDPQIKTEAPKKTSYDLCNLF